MSTLTALNMVLDVLFTKVRPKKEMTAIFIGKGRNKLFLFVDILSLCRISINLPRIFLLELEDN